MEAALRSAAGDARTAGSAAPTAMDDVHHWLRHATMEN